LLKHNLPRQYWALKQSSALALALRLLLLSLLLSLLLLLLLLLLLADVLAVCDKSKVLL
jgi:hypothetical protein